MLTEAKAREGKTGGLSVGEAQELEQQMRDKGIWTGND